MRTRKDALPGAGTPDRATKSVPHKTDMNILPHAGGGEKPKTLFIRPPEVMEMLGVSRSTAGRCVKAVNDRAKAAGLFVVAGACNRRLFMEFIGYAEDVD